MPGSSHQLESKFINDLDPNLREPCMYLLDAFTLHDLLDMEAQNLRPDNFQSFSNFEFNRMLHASILAKVSYFEVGSSLMKRNHIIMLTYLFLSFY